MVYSPCTAVVLLQLYPTWNCRFPRELLVLSCILICDFQKKFTSPSPRIELALAANVVLSGRVVPKNSCNSYSWRVFELGRMVLLMTARQLEYPSKLNCCTAVHYLIVFLTQTVLRTCDINIYFLCLLVRASSLLSQRMLFFQGELPLENSCSNY